MGERLPIFIKSWEECSIGGKIIIQELCKEIEQADLFCADLTHLNANVMFELGYAIATNKRIWLILDTSISDSQKNFDQVRMLTTVGFAPCFNSIDIVNSFYREQPYSDLDNTIFEQAIRPSLSPHASPTLFYLKSRHDTEPSIRLSKRIQKAPIPLRVNDPHESAVQPLSWYGVQVYEAEGVICHFTSPEREGARLHNARYALVAGMAFGMRKPLLMLAEGNFSDSPGFSGRPMGLEY